MKRSTIAGVPGFRLALTATALLVLPAVTAAQGSAPDMKSCTAAGCHDDLNTGAHKHQPSAMGLCTFCHSPHEPGGASSLKFPADTLCLTCHNEVVPDEAVTVHGPVLAGNCTACHNPHSSDFDKQLVKTVPELCFGCHDTEQVDHEGNPLPPVEQVFVDPAVKKHPPFARGACLLCHNPHASDNIRLQRRPYKSAFYTDFSSESYFCLMCHGETTFSEPRTLDATNFRNGNLNLHYRHVARDKGRGCRACHDQHGSVLEDQIATSTSFGSQDVGIRKFVRTENGGTCAPLCHKPVSYDRLDPVDNAMMVTPREGTDATPAELRHASSEHDGKVLYLKRCAGCHGKEAGGKIGPPIKGATRQRVLAAIDRVDLMADLASLGAADLDAIIESLPAGTPIIVPAGGDTSGGVLFSTNCAGCHGPDAAGRIGPDIRAAGKDRIHDAIQRVPMMVAMKALSDEAIGTIAAYLGTLGQAPAPAGASAESAPDGEAVFAMNCQGCHGADAGGQIGPSIRGRNRADVRTALDTVPMMAGLATLGAGEVEAVGAYLGTLAAVAPADSSEQGSAYFASTCAGCHGEDATGHIGPDIRGRSADEIRAAIKRVPMMIAAVHATAQQIESVGNYLQGLGGPAPVVATQPPPDGQSLFNERCAACHGPDATGRIGPDITQASADDIALAIEQVPMMVSMKVLSATDVSAAARYLASLRVSATRPVTQP